MENLNNNTNKSFQPPFAPPPSDNPSTSKKWLWILLSVVILAGVAFLLASTGLFKGSLYVDEKMKEKKLLSESASLPREIETAEKVLNCDVVIAGAGTGGISAAIASAREGAETCLIEETDWLGGMLTSAGVAAIDGRSDTPSGIFHEIIQKIEEFYSSSGIHNCTVSYLCFEPNIGDRVLKEMVKKEENLKIFYNSKINKVYKEGNKILGVNFIQDGISYVVNAKVTVDATEYGDLMFLADIDYDLGTDENSQEPLAKLADQCIQPLTYVAILKEQSTPAIIEMPPDYDREKFKCAIKSPLCPDSNSLFGVERLKSYGRMPNGKLMINIPSHSYGNDFHATSENLENYSREDILEEAKNYSRGFIYFLQSELGFENFALYDEFGTADSFAKMPYVRESRRLKGIRRLTEFDVVKGDGYERADIAFDAIAIGDYPIDLHFCKYGKGDIFKSIAPYQIPYGVTIPEKIDGFMAADKNISVSHIVNGTTRLQPVTSSVGQAVGIAAAMASQQGIEPRDVNVAELQTKLLESGSSLFFFKDLPAQHWAYKGVAQLAIKGLLSGYSDFTFRPDNPVNESELLKMFSAFITLENQDMAVLDSMNLSADSTLSVSRGDIVHYLYQLISSTSGIPEDTDSNINFSDVETGTNLYNKIEVLVSMGIINNQNPNFRPYDNITRAESIAFLARTMDAISKD